MKMVEVKDCGYCPFRCTGEYDEDNCCNIDPGPPPYHRGKWNGVQCSNHKLPDDCPLLKETIRVKAVRKVKTVKA